MKIDQFIFLSEMKISSYSCSATLALLLSFAGALLGFAVAANVLDLQWMMVSGVFGISAGVAMAICWMIYRKRVCPTSVMYQYRFDEMRELNQIKKVSRPEADLTNAVSKSAKQASASTEEKNKAFEFPDIGRWG